MKLRARLKSLSPLTRTICVAIVVVSVAAGLIGGSAGYDSIERSLMPPSHLGPVTTSPDGMWQSRASWEFDGAEFYDEPYINSRIDAWPAGDRDSSRMVFYAFDEMHKPEWIGAHTLSVGLVNESDSQRVIDVAAEPDPEVEPGYEWLARLISVLLMILTPVPALVAVVILVAVKSGGMGQESAPYEGAPQA